MCLLKACFLLDAVKLLARSGGGGSSRGAALTRPPHRQALQTSSTDKLYRQALWLLGGATASLTDPPW